VSDENPLPVKVVGTQQDWVFVNVAAVAITANTPVLAATPNGGRRFRLMGYHIGPAASIALRFKVGTSKTEVLRTGVITTTTPSNNPSGMETAGVPLGQVGDALWLDLSGNTTIHGFLMLKEESV
jgi:hypothetical protein